MSSLLSSPEPLSPELEFQPLFTTLPLPTRASEPCISPLDTHHGHSSFEHDHPSRLYPHPPDSPRDGFEALTFAKIPLPLPLPHLSTNTILRRSEPCVTSPTDFLAPTAPGGPYTAASSPTSSAPSSRQISRSPSLITSLFQANGQHPSVSKSRTNSSSCSSSQLGPITPLSSSPSHNVPAQACRPILRKPAPPPQSSTYTSTSASEDQFYGYTSASSAYGLGTTDGHFGGGGVLGLTQLDKVSEASAGETDRKRNCSLKFAVKHCSNASLSKLRDGARSDSSAGPSRSCSGSSGRGSDAGDARVRGCGRAGSRHLSLSRSPAPVIPESEEQGILAHARSDRPVRNGYGLGLNLQVEADVDGEDESDDEGYQEDSEGGFTSEDDEDDTTTPFEAPLRSRMVWNPNFVATFRPRPTRRASRDAEAFDDDMGVDSAEKYTYCTTDDNAPEPCRGRQISIAAKPVKVDRCSKHLSPPPPSALAGPAPAPPAARSPSAAGLCRRRATRQSEQPLADSTAEAQMRVACRPGTKHASISILRPSTTPLPIIPADQPVSAPVPAQDRPLFTSDVSTSPPISRSSSRRSDVRIKAASYPIPIMSALRSPTPPASHSCSVSVHEEHATVVSPSMSGAREGLEAALKKGLEGLKVVA